MDTKARSLTINAVLNIIKQVCSIIFPMITFPYISRVLGAEVYGKINFGSSIISYISLIATLGITNYAIRECSYVKNNLLEFEKKASEIYSINITTTFISYVVLVMLIIFWPRLKGYEALLFIQSITVIFATIGMDWINVIFEDFAYITIRCIICQTIAVISMLILIKNPNDYLMYALISISSSVLANLSNFFYIRKHIGVNIRFVFHMNFKKHCRPILIMFGGSIASLIYINSDITILGILKGDLEVGYYSTSAKIYTLVKQIINAALMVCLPRISKEVTMKTRKNMEERLSSILNALLVLIGPACTGLFILSKNVIFLFSGKEYFLAYSSLKILSISLPFASIAYFFISVVLIPYGKDKQVLLATSLSAITNIVLNSILIPYFGQDAAAFTTLLAEIEMVCSGVLFSCHLIHLKVWKGLACAVTESIITGVICWGVLNVFSNNFIQIIISMIMSISVCGIVTISLFNKDLKKICQQRKSKANI